LAGHGGCANLTNGKEEMSHHEYTCIRALGTVHPFAGAERPLPGQAKVVSDHEEVRRYTVKGPSGLALIGEMSKVPESFLD
jgi:hypothetical protein